MQLTGHIAGLMGFACEAVLWGAYVILFFLSLRLLFRARQKGYANITIAIASCILFASCTAHFVLQFVHFYVAMEAGDVYGFAFETNLLLGADLMISVCDLLGDFILVYRCWVMWGRNYWVVVLPGLSAAAGFGCIIIVAHIALSLSPESAAPAAFIPLQTAGYVLPLCSNIMATGIILYGIWRMTASSDNSTKTFQYTSRATRAAMAMVVESGSLYLAVQLIFVILIALGHPAQGIIAVIAVQIYGIAPTLIIIRVGLGVAVESTLVVASPRRNSRLPDASPAFSLDENATEKSTGLSGGTNSARRSLQSSTSRV